MREYPNFSKMKDIPHPMQEAGIRDRLNISDEEFEEQIAHLPPDRQEMSREWRRDWLLRSKWVGGELK